MEVLEIKNTSKKIVASEAMLEDSTFTQVCLNRTVFDDIAATNVKISNANLTNLEIEGAQIGGAYIHNIGMPPEGHPAYDPDKKQGPMRFEDCNLTGVRFEDCNLTASRIIDCNLSGMAISDCNTAGMTINGISVDDLLKNYKG